MKTKTDPAIVAQWRTNHHRALETLRAPSCTLSGLQIWRKLMQVESIARACAVAYCNGERVHAYWPLLKRTRLPVAYDFHANGSKDWEHVVSISTDCVRNIFGQVPAGFFVNADARGHALKLDPEKTTIPAGMWTDWGRNGILAAEINGE